LATPLAAGNDRGVELTPAGEALLRHLGPLFDLLDRAFADVEAFAAGALASRPRAAV
jgi:DNA-binding transcriptional LysR family regulator